MDNINLKLIVELKRINSIIFNEINKKLDSLGLQGSGLPMLTYLSLKGKAKTQELGKAASITSGSITHTVNNLVEKNYVTKVQDKADKRIIWVEITQEGIEVFNRIKNQYTNQIFQKFTEEEKSTFINQLMYFSNKLSCKPSTNINNLIINPSNKNLKVIKKGDIDYGRYKFKRNL